MDLSTMTAAEKRELMRKLEEEQKREKEEKRQRIEDYKNLVDEKVREKFDVLKKISEMLSNEKTKTFEDFSTILELKAELFGVKENQQSHTFTTKDGKFSVTMGYRVIDNFDDTVHSGIAKVKNYISRVTLGEKKELEELINLLLKKDKNGNLKASRVLELERIANNIDDEELTEGVHIIKEAYKPAKSSTFLTASYVDDKGIKRVVPLSMTSVEGADEIGEKESN